MVRIGSAILKQPGENTKDAEQTLGYVLDCI